MAAAAASELNVRGTGLFADSGDAEGHIIVINGSTAHPLGGADGADEDHDEVEVRDVTHDLRLAQRRYQQRRRRLIRSNARMKTLDQRVRDSEKERTKFATDIRKEWQSAQRQCWQTHVPLVTLRQQYDRARNRASRNRRILDQFVEDAIGAPPSLGVVLDYADSLSA